MTGDEVVKILGDPELLIFRTSTWGVGLTWSYLPPRRFLARKVRLEVEFDGDGHVLRTTVDGKQVQPSLKWGSP